MSDTDSVVDRLEQVRERRGFHTVKDFWVELIRGGNYEISYAAVTRYHRDRTAPADYLLRVSEVFDVELTWLASGFGIAWKEELIAKIAEASKVGQPGYGELDEVWLAKQRDLNRQLEDVFAEHFSGYSSLPPFVKALISRTWNRLVSREIRERSHTVSAGPPGEFTIHPEHAQVAIRLAKSLQGPLAEYSVESSDLNSWQLESYVHSICQAVMFLDPGV